jgi:hypothetical protein
MRPRLPQTSLGCVPDHTMAHVSVVHGKPATLERQRLWESLAFRARRRHTRDMRDMRGTDDTTSLTIQWRMSASRTERLVHDSGSRWRSVHNGARGPRHFDSRRFGRRRIRPEMESRDGQVEQDGMMRARLSLISSLSVRNSSSEESSPLDSLTGDQRRDIGVKGAGPYG